MAVGCDLLPGIHATSKVARQMDELLPDLGPPGWRSPVPADRGGPCAAERLTSDIGTLLPIALCGPASL